MKQIFVYGTLQKGQGNGNHFGLDDSKYIGRATLYGYTRQGLIHIEKSNNKENYLCGDLFEIDEDVEQQIYEFEKSFGYKREIVNPQKINDGRIVEAIAYID